MRRAAVTVAQSDVQKAVPLLDGLADDIHGAMTAAADSLAAGKPADAVQVADRRRREAGQRLHGRGAVRRSRARKAIAAEEGLIEQSKQGTITSTKDTKETKDVEEEGRGTREWRRKQQEKAGGRLAGGGLEPAIHQRLRPRAGGEGQAGVGAIGQNPRSRAASPGPKAGTPARRRADRPSSRRSLKRALQAGVDLAPKVETLSDRAAASLDAAKPADALPPQEEALKLLKEDAPQAEQQKNDQNKNDQQKKDQNKKDQNKKDQRRTTEEGQDKKNQDKKDQDKKQQDKKNQDKKDKQKQDQKKDQQKNQQKAGRPAAEARRVEAAGRGPVAAGAPAAAAAAANGKGPAEKLSRPDKVDKDW